MALRGLCSPPPALAFAASTRTMGRSRPRPCPEEERRAHAQADDGGCPSGGFGPAVRDGGTSSGTTYPVHERALLRGKGDDQILERIGNAKNDVIVPTGGDDLVLANRYTNDTDVVKGGGGFDKINVADGDTLD